MKSNVTGTPAVSTFEHIPLMKQQFVLTYQYTVLQVQNNLTDLQQTKTLSFYENIRRSNFFVDTTFWEKLCS